MCSAIVILSFTVQVKSCVIQLQNLIIGNMYTNHCKLKKKKKLYPVRPNKDFVDTFNLIISLVLVNNIITFHFYSFAKLLEKVHSYLQTHTT